jgi:putative endonuclease
MQKRRRLAQLALEYLACHRLLERPCRFDVVAIGFDDGRPSVELFQNAFDAA